MSSPILEALPTIHVSAIAIGLTIFVGFAIIAYQDFIKLKSSLYDLKLRMTSAQSPNQKLPSDNDSSLFLKEYALDWDGKAWSKLKELRGFYDPHAEQDVKKQARDLCQIFYLFFTTYPMLGQEMISNPLSEKIWNRKNVRYGIERHDLCNVRLSKLNDFVERYRGQLLEIAKQCDRVETEERRKKYEEARSKVQLPSGYFPSAPNFDPAEAHKNRWEEGVVYYLDLIKKTFIFHDQFRSVVFSYEQGLQDFYIRTLRRPLIPIVIISLIFIVGVITPPIIETVRGDCKFWYPVLDYLMLITCVPYFYALWILVHNSRKFFSDEQVG